MMTIQLLMAFLGTVGFSLRFHLRKALILPASIGGLMGWALYLLFFQVLVNGVFISCLIASICVALYAEILARVL
ncbi:MAG: threonine/serine exporter family protein, partial [Lachnospiraceae bacterium]